MPKKVLAVIAALIISLSFADAFAGRYLDKQYQGAQEQRIRQQEQEVDAEREARRYQKIFQAQEKRELAEIRKGEKP